MFELCSGSINLLNIYIMKFGCCLVAFAGGVLAGSVVALLFAPKKGDELRKDIKEKMNDAKQRLADDMGCCKHQTKVVEDDVTVSFEE